MTTTSAATAVSAARSRLSRPSPPTPWGPPPASRSRTVAGFSFSGSAVGCRRLTADAGMSHCAVPAAWRRRRSKCSRSGSSTGEDYAVLVSEGFAVVLMIYFRPNCGRIVTSSCSYPPSSLENAAPDAMVILILSSCDGISFLVVEVLSLTID